MNLTETLQAIVPVGKYAFWLVGAVFSIFLAGVGFTVKTGDFAELPAQVESIVEIQNKQGFAIDSLRNGMSEAREDRARILCLARLSAIGQTVNALEIDEICS